MRMIAALAICVWFSAQALASFALPKDRSCASVPFRLADNRAVYDVMVEGKGPFHFIFDTGANSILDAGVARALGVALDQAGQTEGAGAATQDTWRTRLRHIAFGGVIGRDVDFMALDLSKIRMAIGFERLDGLMGREVLDAFFVRYDFDARILTICDPAHVPAELRAGTAVAFDRNDYDMPAIEAVIDGRAGRFIVDTGDRSSLTLFGPFVERHRLRQAYPRKVETITGQGVGGPIPADVVKANAFSFSGFTVPDVTVRMPKLRTGAFSASDMAGSIGNGVMRRFNVSFDYRRRTMYLQPNAEFSEHDRYDRSGMWLTGGAPGAYMVAAVTGGGPAANAGIVVGDSIVSVDGVDVRAMPLIELRDRLMDEPAGTRVTFTVEGADSVRREVVVTLADQI